jgi:hypothetical protein
MAQHNIGTRGTYTFTGTEFLGCPSPDEHRPAVIVRVWPGEFGEEAGYNVLVELDGTNDLGRLERIPPCVHGAHLWVTSIKATQTSERGCICVA